MTTDITELAQSLKAAAEKAIAEEGSTWWNEEQLASNYVLALHRTDAKFIALASHENVLSLVEALEKAHAENTAGVAGIAESYETTISMLKSRIAELESRTVTVNLASHRLPSDYVDGEFGNDDLAAIHNACRLECKVSVEKYLSAHGIVVKWEDE